MKHSINTLRHPGGMYLVTSVFKLALWRWRQHWFLLLLSCVGMVAAVTIMCTVPLLSETMQTAGLRNVLRASPGSSEIALRVQTAGLSTQAIEQIAQSTNSPVEQHLGMYLNGSPRLDIETPLFSTTSVNSAGSYDLVKFYGTSMREAASHVQLVRGQLPDATSTDVEVAVTPQAAQMLHLHVGSVLVVDFTFYSDPVGFSLHASTTFNQKLDLHVVGIFNAQPTDPFWHGVTFLPESSDSTSSIRYTLLVSEQNLLATLDHLATSQGIGEVFFLESFYLHWYYQLASSRISVDQLNDLINQLATIQTTVAATNPNRDSYLTANYPYVQGITLSGAVLHASGIPSILETYRSQLAAARAPLVLLTLQILGLILLFVGLMAQVLVDRQADIIALLRSRGASRRQVFGALATQSIVLSLVALMIGPLLAIGVVYFIAARLLSAATQDAVNVISRAPLLALFNIRGYAIAAVIIAIAVMMFALYRASRADIWSTNSQASYSSRRPLWQRFHLDFLAVVIALTSYGISFYLSSIEQLLDAQTQQLVVSPLTLLTPLFLLLAAVLLFLRLFPWLLQWVGSLVARGRGAPPLLATAQMARTPRQSIRMILLLALTIAFALFSLIFVASQAQRAQDIAAYEAGADFSGDIPTSSVSLPLQEEIARYEHIAGVTAATAGYIEDDTSSASAPAFPVQLRAVDPGSFTRATIWPSQYASQPLPPHLAQLASQRAEAIDSGVLPAIIDSSTQNALNLHVGSSFALYNAETPGYTMHYVVIGEVQQLPGIDGSSEGGIIVDYQSFATVALSTNKVSGAVNHVWLQTRSDSAALASVRAALNTPALQLENLHDRRALIESLDNDPLSLNLVGLLIIGATMALGLALAGNLLISWLSVRRRLTNFIVLRALGAGPKQIAHVLLWEQGMIYTTALFLGILFGTLLAFTAVPTLVFNSLPVHEGASASNSIQPYSLQHILPPQIVVPASLGIGFIVLIGICILVLGMMVRVVLQPSMDSVLRVDENQSSPFLTREDPAILRFPRGQTVSSGTHKPSLVRLAFWQLRRSWFLLLMQGVGMLAAVIIVCSVPLFSTISATAGLHDTLNASPDTSTITLDTATQGLSSKIFRDVQQQFDLVVQQYIGAYLARPTPFSIRSKGFTLMSSARSMGQDNIELLGTSMIQAAPFLTLLQGQLPKATSTNGEIDTLLAPATAQKLHLSVGSVITLRGDFFPNPQETSSSSSIEALRLHISGLFTIPAAKAFFWHGEDFQPSQENSYTFLVPSQVFLTGLDQLAATSHTNAIFSPQNFELLWQYRLDTAHIAVDSVDDLSSKLTQLQANMANKAEEIQNAAQSSAAPTYPYLVTADFFNPAPASYVLPNILDGYRNRSAVVSIPMTILTLQILGLVLLFVGLLANLLVDRQAETIAVLRSRGASSRQIFGPLLIQSAVLATIAFVVGPLLAVISVSFVAQHILGSTEQNAIGLITGSPVQAALTVVGYAAVTMLTVIVVMTFLLWRAARMNILLMRRETARTTQHPLWQRLHLDVVAAIIALVGYGISLYLASVSTLFDARTKILVAAPLTLVAPLFLLIAVLILFLRFFTSLLRLGARFAALSRGAISMLALSQMARTPRQAVRMTLLLALAVAFAIFTLVFAASQRQHIRDLAAYESGADFSGNLSSTFQYLPLSDVTERYRHIPGVTSATVGYTGEGAVSPDIPIEIRAVDADTFSQTAIWTRQDSTQTLASLMAQLVAARGNALYTGEVPAIVDAATMNRLDLHVGDSLMMTVNDLQNATLRCRILAEVQHIPTINSTDFGSGGYTPPGGVLLDYQSYASVYITDVIVSGSRADLHLPLNHVWLRTKDDPAAVAQVRTALLRPGLRLANLYDRQRLITSMSSDPLYLNLLLLLVIGAGTTLLLTLVGDLLTSWLSIRLRLTSFVALRALGASTGQITRVLLWEQLVIYIVALFLGILFGAVLSATAIPSLAISSIPVSGIFSSMSSEEFYALQHLIPAQVVLSPSLGVAFSVLVLICVMALGIMAGVVLRPSMSQTLRVSED